MIPTATNMFQRISSLFPGRSVGTLPPLCLLPIPLAHIRGHYKLTVLQWNILKPLRFWDPAFTHFRDHKKALFSRTLPISETALLSGMFFTYNSRGPYPRWPMFDTSSVNVRFVVSISLSASFHQCPTRIFIYRLLLLDRQRGEAWQLPRKQCSFGIQGGSGIEVLSLSP